MPDDVQDRVDQRNDKLDDRRDEAKEDYDRETYTTDEYYEDSSYWRVGTSISASRYRSLECTATTVNVNSITYYQCGETWYNRSYAAGEVNYIVVNPPPGH